MRPHAAAVFLAEAERLAKEAEELEKQAAEEKARKHEELKKAALEVKERNRVEKEFAAMWEAKLAEKRDQLKAAQAVAEYDAWKEEEAHKEEVREEQDEELDKVLAEIAAEEQAELDRIEAEYEAEMKVLLEEEKATEEAKAAEEARQKAMNEKMLKNRKEATKAMPRLWQAKNLDGEGAQRARAAYAAAWKAKSGKAVTQAEVDQLAEVYGLPPEAVNLKKTKNGWRLANEQLLSNEALDKFADGLIRLYRDISSVKIIVPDVVVASAEDAANAVPNEVYDPVSDTFVEGRIVIDAEGAKSFREQAGMEEPSVTAGELMEAKERHGARFSIGADKRISAALEGVNEERISAALDSLLSNGRIDVRGTDGEKLAAKLAAQEFFKKYAKMKIQLSTGAVLFFAPDEATLERNGGDKSAAWAEYALHQVTSNQTDKEGKNYRAYNKSKVEVVNPMLEKIVLEDKAEINKNGNVIFYSQLNDEAYAKVIAKPLEDGNYRADLSDVTSVYEKGKVPGKLNPLAEVVDKDGLGGVFTSKSTPHIIPYFGVGSQGGNSRFSIADWEGVNKRVAAVLEKERQRIEAEGGKLLLAWHGTSSYGFTEFRDTFDFGFFFAKSRATAKGYVREQKKYGGGIYHVALRMMKPYIVDCKGAKWNQIQDANHAVAFYKDPSTGEIRERTLYPGQPWNLREGEKVFYPTEKTRDIVHRARAWGYDGVIFQNIRDAGSNHASQEADDVYVVFDAKQIKSVAGVTRDDDGKIIPLSRRFDWNNNSDIRFSIGGVERAKAKLEKWHVNVSEKSVREEIANFIDDGVKDGRIRLKSDGEKLQIAIAANQFFKDYAHKVIELSDGRCVYFAPDTKNLERGLDNSKSWAVYCVHAVTHGGKTAVGQNFPERVWSPLKVENIARIESILKAEKCFARLDENSSRDRIVFVGETIDKKRMDIITRLDEYGNVDADLTEITAVMVGKETPPLKCEPLTEVVRKVAIHQADGYSPLTGDIIPQHGVGSQGGNLRFSIAKDVAARLNEERKEVEKIGGQLLLAHHGTNSRGFTRFEKTDDIGYFFAKSGVTAGSYVRGNNKTNLNRPGLIGYTEAIDWLRSHKYEREVDGEVVVENILQHGWVVKKADGEVLSRTDKKLIEAYEAKEDAERLRDQWAKIYDGVTIAEGDVYKGEEFYEGKIPYGRAVKLYQVERPGVGGGGIYNVALRMEKPYVVDCKGRNWNEIQDDSHIPEDAKVYNVARIWVEFDEDGKIRKYQLRYSEEVDGITHSARPHEYDTEEEFLNGVRDILGTAMSETARRILPNFAPGVLNEDNLISSEWAIEPYVYSKKLDTGFVQKEEMTTRQVVAKAKALGYDGVIFKNVIDNGGGLTEESVGVDDVYVVMNSNQIKSVDDVTYDDDGNIIPVDRRFDWSNPDIRFSLSGIGKLDDAESVKRFKAYMEKLPAAVMPKRLASGTPQAALEWFEKNMVGRTFQFYIPKYGYREFTATPGHIGKLVCEGGKRADGTKIVKGRIAKANGDAAKGLEMVRRGEVSAAEVEGWSNIRAKSLPLVPEVLTDFDAALHEKDARSNDIVIFLKKFTNKDGRSNTVVMKLVNDTLIGPLSAHVRDMTGAWLKNKDLLLTNEGEVYDRSTNNSASRKPFAGDNAEGNSPENADIIPQNGVGSQGGNSRFSISGLYTGSAADFDKPSLKYVGTGVGAQIYGHGLYASPSFNTATEYARMANKAFSGMMQSVHTGHGRVDTEAIKRAMASMDEPFQVLEQTFFTNRAPGDESHLLVWEKPLSAENEERILAQAKNEGIGEKVRETLEEIKAERGAVTGKDIIKRAFRGFRGWTPREVSAFLVRADIDGLKMPFESWEGDTQKYNYVSFRDDNIRVDHKWVNGEKRFSIGEPRGVQKEAGVNYPDAADEIAAVEQDVRFSIGSKKAAEYRAIIAKKRPDLDAAEIDATMGEIAKFETPKAQKAALNWYVKGRLRLPEDAPKVTQALEYAEKAKADPMQFAGPVELMEALHEFKPKAKMIDPDTVPYLSDKRDMGHGVTTYLVDESRESQQAMREIINTHWGEDANPWCLLHGDGHGHLSDGTNGEYDARYYWKHYNALPKRVAFKNGKLLAFMATDKDMDLEYKDYSEEWGSWLETEEGRLKQTDYFTWVKENFPQQDEQPEEWWDRTDHVFANIPFANMKVPGDPYGRWADYELINGEIVQTEFYRKGTSGANGFRQWRKNGLLEYAQDDDIEKEWNKDGDLYRWKDKKRGIIYKYGLITELKIIDGKYLYNSVSLNNPSTNRFEFGDPETERAKLTNLLKTEGRRIFAEYRQVSPGRFAGEAGTRFSLGVGMDAALDKFARGEDAVIHNEYGDVAYEFGTPGHVTANGNIRGGHGLLHIIYSRMLKDGETFDEALETALRVGDAIERGTTSERRGNKVYMRKDGVEGIFADNGNGQLVLTGYRIKADETGVSQIVPPALRTASVPRKEDVVAALPHIIPQIRGKSQGGTTRFSIGALDAWYQDVDTHSVNERLNKEYEAYIKNKKEDEPYLSYFDWRDKFYPEYKLAWEYFLTTPLGKLLAKEQRRLKKKGGLLLPAFHGTKRRGFTKFGKTDDIGYFFAKTPNTASSYLDLYTGDEVLDALERPGLVDFEEAKSWLMNEGAAKNRGWAIKLFNENPNQQWFDGMEEKYKKYEKFHLNEESDEIDLYEEEEEAEEALAELQAEGKVGKNAHIVPIRRNLKSGEWQQLTADEELFASLYAEGMSYQEVVDTYLEMSGQKSGIYNVVLRMEKPYIVDCKGRYWNEIQDDSNIPEDAKTFTFAKMMVDFDEDGKISKYRLVYIEETSDGSSSHQREFATEEKFLNAVRDIFGTAIYKSAKKCLPLYMPGVLEEDNLISSKDGTQSYVYSPKLGDGFFQKEEMTTRDVVAKAKALGYDGVVFKNVRDYGGGVTMKGEKTDDVYVVMEANQIKALDKLTYDDEGNLIDLNKRLDWSNDDMRYSIGGARGVNPHLREDIERAMEGNDAHGKIIMGYTPEKLVAMGIPAGQIYTKGYVLRKLKKEHNLDAGAVTDLASAVASPVAVFDDNMKKGFLVLTEQKAKDKDGRLAPVVVVLRPDANGNYMASAYSKTTNGEDHYINLINAGRLLYVEKDKIAELGLTGEANSSFESAKAKFDNLSLPHIIPYSDRESQGGTTRFSIGVNPNVERELEAAREAREASRRAGVNRARRMWRGSQPKGEASAFSIGAERARDVGAG